MADIEKLAKTLDGIEAKLTDYEKSQKAQAEAATKGEAALRSELDAMRKQNQEIMEIARSLTRKDSTPEADERVKLFGPNYRDLFKAIGKGIKSGIIGRAASEGTDASGGYLVPEEWATVLRSVQNRYGVIRQIFGAEIFPMKSDKVYVPTDTTEETATNRPTPASTSENAAITESTDAKLGQVTLTASKYATLNYISNELLEDAFLDFLGAFLTPKLVRQASRIEDDYCFNNATYGLLKSSNFGTLNMAAGKTAFTDIDADDLFDLQDEIDDDAEDGAMYIAHRTIITQIRKLRDSQRQLLWAPLAAGEPASIAGYPYMKARVMPKKADTAVSTKFLLYGDVKMASVFGERTERRIVTSSDFRFNYDQLAVRMTWRFAFNSNSDIGRAVCGLKTAAE